VIVDEVDSMLLDQSGHSTKLIDKMPAMDYLEPVMALIWRKLNTLLQSLLNNNGMFIALQETNSNVENFFDCILKILPENVKQENKIFDEKGLKELMKDFSHKLIKETLNDETAIENIVQIIKTDINSICESEKILAIFENIENISEIDKTSPAISQYINECWSLDSKGNLLKIVENLFNIQIIVSEFDENEELIPSVNYLYNTESKSDKTINLLLSGNCFYIMNEIPDIDSYCYTTVERDVRQHLNLNSEEKNKNKLSVPKHHFEYINRKFKLWIKSAITSKLNLEENRHYIIKSDMNGFNRIIPVDFQSTG
jgi:hypothetical protein